MDPTRKIWENPSPPLGVPPQISNVFTYVFRICNKKGTNVISFSLPQSDHLKQIPLIREPGQKSLEKGMGKGNFKRERGQTIFENFNADLCKSQEVPNIICKNVIFQLKKVKNFFKNAFFSLKGG